jgi:hypothetical protein
MSKKKVFPLRLDDKLFEKIEKWAGDEFRSSNGQIEWIIREALKKAGRLNEKSTREKDA